MKGISVLIAVYEKDNDLFLDKAFKSIWDGQIRRPDQIVLVKDGLVTDELEDVIGKWQVRLKSTLVVVPLLRNVGLALALNEGLNFCDYEFVARMDSDDISTENRFSRQEAFLEKNKTVDVVGTYVEEIDEFGSVIKEEAKLPLNHDELLDVFKKRNPLFHPTVMFRKSFFDKAGNYCNELLLAEDLYLWYKGFLTGCRFANIPLVGLRFRRSEQFYTRRKSLKKLRAMLYFRITKCNRDLNLGIYADLCAIGYFFFQIAPLSLRKFGYRFLR